MWVPRPASSKIGSFIEVTLLILMFLGTIALFIAFGFAFIRALELRYDLSELPIVVL